MEITELVLIAIASTVGPTVVDLLFQYGIHRHMEKERPRCKTCALRSAIEILEDIEH